ncbi:glycine-rich cell wall structural protein 1 isoform X2 [Oreochromis niloticus]|uniref:glycine-rich cell wall structural protein 1 isoform X2 n=1 Tax=Oreochromis niloticus TaxID=8128 RepID=UPI000DF36232|nr:glycine-rich cell wall structural protein 1 isoform X2 [Oreochromis niloticus]
MLLDVILRVSWICFLFFGRGACLPVFVKGQSGSTGRLGHLGWVPGTGGVGAVRWVPGTGLLGGGSSGSLRVGTGDWTFGAGRSAALNVGTTGVGRDSSVTAGVGAGSFSTSGVDVGSSVTAGVGAGTSGGAGTVSVSAGSSGRVGAGSSGSGGVGIGGFTGSSYFAGFPLVNDPAGGAPSSFDQRNWMSPQTSPDFNAWYAYHMPLGMFMAPPALPSSYIIQNGNGYQRGREAFSYSKYTDDVYSPFPLSPVLPRNPESVPVADSQRVKV